ncbi:beta-lactamase/transpeptidase-like protein [Thozetella sp. PMI_491]|nr:beta-lactamase/transpeptidase-like protein [Thozetella sp. PMI_491]
MQLVYVPIFLVSAAPVLADFLGSSYAPPADLTSNGSLVAAGWKNITSTLEIYLRNDSQDSNPASAAATALLKNVTFSLGMFSLRDTAATDLQFHYTSPEIATAPNGTHRVDADSIYRIASVTKVFTVLAGLLELKSADWDTPLTELLPALAEYASSTPAAEDPAYTVAWDQVTVAALASQISGVPRDGFPALGELLFLAAIYEAAGSPFDVTKLGLPILNQSDPLANPPCAAWVSNGSSCPEEAYVDGVKNRPPAFAPWTTPGYSNDGFTLLGVALSKITGKPLDQLYCERIFDPLGMTSSNSSTPPESEWYRSVIPGAPTDSFAIDAGIFVSSGGLLSTLNDIARFGKGILNSTLLSADQTRKWMKPVSHTARFQYSVGKPWEILRYTHSSGVTTDMYTKLGDSGAYTSFFVLLPEYEAGFTVMSCSTLDSRAQIMSVVADLVTETILPALAAQAAAEAERNFAGVYVPAEAGLNSSLTLVVNQDQTAAPGVTITSWISNGTDVMAILGTSIGPQPWRLVPSVPRGANGKAAFRLISNTDVPSVAVTGGLFSSPALFSSDWINVDQFTYGGIGVSLFVFDIADDGSVVAVSPAAFRATYNRLA